MLRWYSPDFRALLRSGALFLAAVLAALLTTRSFAQEPAAFTPHLSEPATLSETTGYYGIVELLAGPDGNAHLVWIDDNVYPFTRRIVARTRSADGEWGEETQLSDPENRVSAASAAIDDSGIVHAVWTTGGKQLSYRWRDTAGLWHPALTWEECGLPPGVFPTQAGGAFVTCGNSYVMRVDPGGVSHDPLILDLPGITRIDAIAYAAGPDGLLHAGISGWGATAYLYDVYYSGTDGIAGWSTPVNLSNTVTKSYAPLLALDPANTLHFVWSDRGGPENDDVFLRMRKDGQWLPAQTVVTGDENQWPVWMSFSSLNTLHLVYRQSYGFTSSVLRYTRRASGHWDAAYDGLASGYALDISAEGTAHALTSSYFGNGVRYAFQESTQSWSEPILLTANTPSNLRIGVRSDDRLFAAWTERVPDTRRTAIRFAYSTPENAPRPSYLPFVTK